MAAAREDKEEWVGIIGKAVGNFDAPLDLEAVCNGSSIVSVQTVEAAIG